MKLDPRHLEILAAIVDHGGLTGGAAALGKSQPSVSRSLALLEGRLGAALFEPGRRPLKPTGFCLELAREGRRISRAGKAAGALVDRFRGGLQGAVRVSGTPIFMDGVVSPILAAFQSGHPDIQIVQGYGYAAEILSRIGDGTLDMGIVPVRPPDVPPGIEATRILPGRNVIACRAGHPMARKPSVTLSEIAACSWIAPPPDSPLYRDLRGVLNDIGVRDFKVSFSGGSLASVTNVLSGSDALTVLPYAVVFALRRRNTLAALPIRIGDPDRHPSVLTRKDGDASPARARLASFVQGEFKAMLAAIRRHEKGAAPRG